MKKLINNFAFFITLLLACQNNSKSIKQDDADIQDTLVRHEEKHSQQVSPVALNNGEKWTANAETTFGIKKMTALIENFPNQPKSGDFQSLKVKLETEFNLIIQKCTMTGEAHAQLHKYLIPMTDIIKKLNSEDMKVSEKALGELKQHLAEYQNYFQ